MTTHLDLVYVADSMVKLNRAPALHVCLVRGIAVHDSLPRWCRCQSMAGVWCITRPSVTLSSPTSLLRTSTLEVGGILRCSLDKETGAILDRCAKCSLWAFYAVLGSLLPLTTSLWKEGLVSN